MPHIPGHQSSYSYGFSDPFEEFVDTRKNENVDSIPDAFASIGAFANLPAEQVANAMSGVFNTAPGGQRGLTQRTNQEILSQNIMANVAKKEYDDNVKELAKVKIYPQGSSDLTSALARVKPGDLFPEIIAPEFVNDDFVRNRAIESRKQEIEDMETFADSFRLKSGEAIPYGIGGLGLERNRVFTGGERPPTFTTFDSRLISDRTFPGLEQERARTQELENINRAFRESLGLGTYELPIGGISGAGFQPMVTPEMQDVTGAPSFIQNFGSQLNIKPGGPTPADNIISNVLPVTEPSAMGYSTTPMTRDLPDTYVNPETGELVVGPGGDIDVTSEVRRQALADALGQGKLGLGAGRLSVSDLNKIAAQTADEIAPVQPGRETTTVAPEDITYDPRTGTYGEATTVPSGIQETTKKEKTTAEKIKEMTEDAGTTEGPIPGVSSAFGTEEYPLTYIAPNGTVYNWKSDGKGGAIFEFKEGELAFKASQVSGELRDSTSTGKEVKGTVTSVKPGGPPAAAVTATPGGTTAAGTPTIPAGTITPSAANLFANQYEEGLEPFEQYLRYRQSAFPDATLGQRIAAQPSLGYGYQPTLGRFLLGTAAERFLPQEGLSPGAEFASYLRGQPRADLSQIRQEYANLAQALGAYGGAQDVSQINQPVARYTGIFGAPGEDKLRGNILSATQAALGCSAFLDDRSLGRVYDAMEQQYGADVGARFADFVGRGFGLQGNLPTTPVAPNPMSYPIANSSAYDDIYNKPNPVMSNPYGMFG